ncbi:CPBP family intramembrane glutamic endopeptidase [Halopiger xanaduensis]|uniref:Abortive infection protein n=1 Tax=Halopiger xanaduensis (strain DSM 18323 / JCM 14033 / SH-6) TaxID=797210 RepID=F8DAZ3_HALXS|nr:CPBP family intramembrane glutamic endopeptidase [Halopiger xanaduensis]AEH38234.1 Abortive infection protein [Halopiger xanaduensis SH-6]
MTETARADDAAPIASDAVPGIGTVLAAVTMAATFVPVTRGVDSPAVSGAAAFAVAAVLAFLARRHGVADRRIAAAVAAASSVVVLLCAGYALNQGVAASVNVPGVGISLSLVFTAFVTAGLSVGVGVADYFGVGPSGLKARSLQTATLGLLGFGGLFAAQIATLFLVVPVVMVLNVPFESLSDVQLTVVSQFGMALGTAVLAVGYLSASDLDRSFLDLSVPSKRDLGWIVGGVVVIFGAIMAITFVFQTAGVESAEHGTTQQAAENPTILLVLIPASILVIGPFEELLYRNVIQKSLYGTFSRYGAVVVGSVIFAIIHTQAYWTAGPGQVAASLGTVFGLSIVLGTVYERTDNLVVPALVHGIYNAVVFANLYVGYV